MQRMLYFARMELLRIDMELEELTFQVVKNKRLTTWLPELMLLQHFQDLPVEVIILSTNNSSLNRPMLEPWEFDIEYMCSPSPEKIYKTKK